MSAAREPATPQPSPELRTLGARLFDSTDRISVRAQRPDGSAPIGLDSRAQHKVTQMIEISFRALAQWMVGGGTETGLSFGAESEAICRQLASEQLAPLNEITRCTLRWREATWETLNELAGELGVSELTRTEAQRMIQRSFDVAIVSLCEAFERERRNVETELSSQRQELEYKATHDTLTGLPNRTLIVDRAEQMLTRARRERQPCAALFVDIDGFKAINDGLGQRAGDELLRAVAARIAGAIREADALGRLAGDEFVVLVEGIALAAGPELVADRILEALRHPFELSEVGLGRVAVSASIGIASGDRECASDLLRDAHIAMYQAKLGARGRHVVFQSEMQDAVNTRLELEMELREAVAGGDLFVAYQPMFELDAMTPVRMEALLRWRRSNGLLEPPDEFVPVLEESGLIGVVGRWVLVEACGRCAHWLAGGRRIGVAVNVSAVQLEHDDFVGDVADALEISGLDPGMLTLEITETALMRDADATARRLAAVKELGVRLSIDDFGTGYSSLAYLERFPVDELKFDRSFIARLAGTAEGSALIRTFVSLGRSLEIETIAEGIEQHDQLRLLKAEACDIGQGFLFARPMDVAACEEFIGNWVPQAVA